MTNRSLSSLLQPRAIGSTTWELIAVIAAFITSKSTPGYWSRSIVALWNAAYPICVAIGRDSGLKKKSIVNLRTLDKSRLTGSKLATLTDELMEKVDMALKNSLALQ